MVEGHLTIRFSEGIEPRQVGPGEFYMFPSSQPHRYCNENVVTLRFVRNVVL